jgi:hypothetical protein
LSWASHVRPFRETCHRFWARRPRPQAGSINPRARALVKTASANAGGQSSAAATELRPATGM